MRIIFNVIISLFLFVNPSFAQLDWKLYEETNISSEINGSIKKGHIFKTLSGNIYEITDYVYLYEYEYSPRVIVLRSGDIYKLNIDGFEDAIHCINLNSNSTGEELNIKTQTSKALEAYITSDFEGYEIGNIYVLSNDQIWEQTEFYTWVWVWSMPKVLIYETNGIYKMKFDQIEHSVTIKKKNEAPLIRSHNQTTGNLQASEQYRRLTRRLVEIGRAFDLPIVDHVILSSEGYFSFADEGEL